jgi:hypothetical protein
VLWRLSHITALTEASLRNGGGRPGHPAEGLF